jgi:hypothetical protein
VVKVPPEGLNREIARIKVITKIKHLGEACGCPEFIIPRPIFSLGSCQIFNALMEVETVEIPC